MRRDQTGEVDSRMIKESQWKIPVNGYGQAICPFYDDSDKTCLKKSARQLSNVGCEHKGDMIMCPTMSDHDREPRRLPVRGDGRWRLRERRDRRLLRRDGFPA